MLGNITSVDFSGLVVVDWEDWRPLAVENDDAISYFVEYSRRLVAAERPSWNESRCRAEGVARFNAGARAFFTVTVETIRRLRPRARIGFYSQARPPPLV